MLKEILKRKTETKRKIEINPYITDIGARRGESIGIVDTILSFIPFRKKKEEPRVNPFLSQKPMQDQEVQSVAAPEPGKKPRGWLWYIPVVIAEQVEWAKSYTAEEKRIIARKREEKARYDAFMDLCGKKD